MLMMTTASTSRCRENQSCRTNTEIQQGQCHVDGVPGLIASEGVEDPKSYVTITVIGADEFNSTNTYSAERAVNSISVSLQFRSFREKNISPQPFELKNNKSKTRLK